MRTDIKITPEALNQKSHLARLARIVNTVDGTEYQASYHGIPFSGSCAKYLKRIGDVHSSGYRSQRLEYIQ
jgi:hypothetical protein